MRHSDEISSGLNNFYGNDNNVSTIQIDFYRKMMELGKLVLTEWDEGVLLKYALDLLKEILNAEYGAIVFIASDLTTKTAFFGGIIRPNVLPKNLLNNQQLIRSLKQTGDIFILPYMKKAISIRQFKTQKKLEVFGIILPLKYQFSIFGFIFLVNPTSPFKLNERILSLLMAVTEFVSSTAYRIFSQSSDGHFPEMENNLRKKFQFGFIVGHHPRIIEILKIISQVADTDATVLIQGESGTGKDLIAQALHYNSSRRNKPFIPINCGALPDNLLDSELFGHVRGAFTGAVKDREGCFECADGGTIFLDEVQAMSPTLQIKLLRVLQTGQFCRLGSNKVQTSDVRVIAATTENLAEMCRRQAFREELYYRLNVIDIVIPPLRNRKCDIPILARHFLKYYGVKYGKENLVLSREAEDLLLAYDYPGNVRELENIIERTIVLAEEQTIQPEHLPPTLRSEYGQDKRRKSPPNFKLAKQKVIEKFEQEYIKDCLKACNGNISQAARTAGLHFSNFYAKMKKYRIQYHLFKAMEEL